MCARDYLTFVRALALLLAFALLGCNSKPAMVPLTGSVKFDDGSPAEGAYVIFESMDKPMSATATVAADGSFTVRTTGSNDGIATGKYRVAVTPPARDDVNGKWPVMALHPKYKAFETSGLEFTIDDNPKPIELVVTRK